VALPARTTQLQIAYTALSLSIPDRVKFRYRLSGVDTAWTEAGTRREAIYTNLRPGSYRFQVIAANEDNVWNQGGASLALEIPPTFTETKLFVGLIATMVAGAVWLLARWRQQQLARALRAQYEGQLAERTRIAQDLHDTLLQGFTGVSLQVVAATERVSGPPEVIRTLRDIVTLAQQTLTEARQAIWDIRSADLEHQSLADALEAAARSAVAGNGVGVSVATSGPARRMASDLETTALRVGREAILNALKHAAPTHLDIALEYAPERFVLRVRDDGLGMTAAVVDGATGTGHWGVAGMRQRAQRAGGSLDIVTQPGLGTVVSLRLPLVPVTPKEP
jgi:signal transduction histidine kinase